MEFKQQDLKINGHAIEVRINAEKLPNFTTSRRGGISQHHAPGGLGVRVDSAIYDGYRIPPYYDSLIGKLTVHGRNRPEALARLQRAWRTGSWTGSTPPCRCCSGIAGKPRYSKG